MLASRNAATSCHTRDPIWSDRKLLTAQLNSKNELDSTPERLPHTYKCSWREQLPINMICTAALGGTHCVHHIQQEIKLCALLEYAIRLRMPAGDGQELGLLTVVTPPKTSEHTEHTFFVILFVE